MVTALLILGMFLVGTIDNTMANKKHFKERKSGDVIYQWNKSKTGILKYSALGQTTCRPQEYRRFRLPFQSHWKEVAKEGEVDYCTGEVYQSNQWVERPDLITNSN